MNTSVLKAFSIVTCCVFCVVYVYASEVESKLTSKYQVQLKPKSIESRLGQLVLIRLPKRQKNAALYLTKPDGTIIVLCDKSRSKIKRKRHKSYRKNKNILTENSEIVGFIGRSHIALGPLSEEDNGNWVISNLLKNSKGETVEKYKFISIRIIENVPPESSSNLLHTGDTFELALSHAPAYLASCELVPPSTTSDRYYERDLEKLSTCGYQVPNVTTLDTGIWTVIAVGKIAFTTKVELTVVDKVLDD